MIYCLLCFVAYLMLIAWLSHTHTHTMLLDADSAQGEGKSKRKRCTFWPQCANGAQCPFYHPTENCKYVPVASPSSADEAHIRHRACSTRMEWAFYGSDRPFRFAGASPTVRTARSASTFTLLSRASSESAARDPTATSAILLPCSLLPPWAASVRCPILAEGLRAQIPYV
jgi:hypothetical protein